MNRTNDSLTKFSGFIIWSLASGLVGLFVAFLLFMNQSSSPTNFALGAFLAYASSSAIGLAVVGAFLRQTARVIVEGMGGNLNEVSDSFEDLTFTSDNRESRTDSSFQDARASELSMMQKVQWEENGRPHLADWDGSIKFTTWLRAQKDRQASS